MSNASLQASPEIEDQDILECVHYWVIDVPSGPVSGGRCRLCGESREFRNSLDSASGWDDDRNAYPASLAVRSSLNQPRRVEAMSDMEE